MRTPTRTHPAEKAGQATLNQFYEGHTEGHTAPRRSMNTLKDSVISVQAPLTPYHKGHRYLFVFNYTGQQPIYNADSESRFGWHNSVRQARFNYSEDKAIVFSLPHTLKIWIKHPIGSRTAKELAEARKTARQVAESFSRKHGILITSEKQAGFSEHTVENKPLDALIRPLPTEEPELAKERLGLSINHTSHKNKVEWTGKSAKERVMGLEHLLDDPITKSDMREILKEFAVEFAAELKEALLGKKPEQEAPARPYEGGDYV